MTGSTGIGEYLRQRVYPELDAAEKGLLDDLNPRPHGRYYSIDCPQCETSQSAFYYPGSGVVTCNRRNNCGQTTTGLWEIVARKESSKRAVLERLCAAAGVPLPDDGRTKTQKTAASLAFDLLNVLREALWTTPEAITYLREERGMTETEIKTARIGYYPHPEHVAKALAARGAHMPSAHEWGIISDKTARKFSGRIVGYWEQPDGSLRLWGRAFGRSLLPYLHKGELVEPEKYEFQYGMVKTIPYRFSGASRRSPLVAVEGPLDVERMVINGIPAIGVGGAMVIEAQAAFLAGKGVSTVVHLTDGDRAGYQGGLKTIENAEPLGISVMIAEVPAGMDDPDKLIASNGTAPLNSLLENAQSAGSFLVKDIVAHAQKPTAEYPILVRDRMRLAEKLTPASRIAFDLAAREHGLHLPNSRATALRTMATLQELGVAQGEIDRVISQRFGVTVRMEEAPEDE